MKKVLYRDYNFEITKREVFASIVIILLMICAGLFISEKISSKIDEKNEKYYSAIKIKDDYSVFDYGMRTNVGYAFVHGDMKAVDPVTYPEIGNEYMAVEKIKERYTMHTRRVAHTRTVNGKTSTYYTTETYWTWDEVGREDIHCSRTTFCGATFDYGKINVNHMNQYIDTIKENSNIRYKYYGIPRESSGTIFTKLYDGTIEDNSNYYSGKSIDEALNSCITKGTVIKVLFWIVWIVLTGAAVFGFYYLDNEWLED